MNIPDNVLNPKLYRKAKKIADETYKRDGAYKSMFLVKKYKELGGRYSNSKVKSEGTTRWNKEKWVSVVDYLNGKNIACGDDKAGRNVCRPTIKVTKNTPMTIDELIKKHGKPKLKKLINMKLKDMDGRLNWEKGEFISSK